MFLLFANLQIYKFLGKGIHPEGVFNIMTLKKRKTLISFSSNKGDYQRSESGSRAQADGRDS